MLRHTRIVCEYIAAGIGLAVLLSALLIWRLDAAPFSSSILTPYFEKVAEYVLPGIDAEIGQTLVTWDNVSHAFTLQAYDVVLKDQSGDPVAELPQIDIRFSLSGLLRGQLLPATLLVANPHLKLERQTDGSWSFGEMSSASPGGNSSKALRRMMAGLLRATFMHKLSLTEVRIDVFDAASKNQWTIDIPQLGLERAEGQLEGQGMVNLAQAGHFATLDMRYAYDNAAKRQRLSLKFDGITPALLAVGDTSETKLALAAMINLPLTGELDATLDKALTIESVVLHLHGDEGTLNNSDFWDQPRRVDSLNVTAVYDRDSQLLNVAPVVIDLGGPKLDLSVVGAPPSAPGRDLDFTMTIRLIGWPMDQYGALWPKPVLADARDWIAAHISKGTFDHAETVLKGHLSWNDVENLTIDQGQGKISASHATVAYLGGMPPVQDAGAEATFDLKQMGVQITGGGIGNLQLQPFTIVIGGLADPDQDIDIPLKLTGPLTEVMQLIDHPPLGYAKRIGLAPDQITGNASGDVDLRFPLSKTLAMSDIDVHAKAALTDVASSKLVRGVEATGGTMDLELDKDGFTVKGHALLNKIPSDITWHENFDPCLGQPVEQATVTGTIRDEEWAGVGYDVPGFAHGDSIATLQVVRPNDKRITLTGRIDMTAAQLDSVQANWKKPAGTPLLFTFTADLPDGKDIIKVTAFDLSGAATMKGTAVMTPDGAFKTLDIDPVKIGRTDGALRYTVTGNALRIDARGAAFDISGLHDGKDASAIQSREYHLDAGRLYAGTEGFIDGAKGYAVRDAQGWSAAGLHGMANGKTRFDLDIVPQGDGRALTIACDDFGEALKGLGLTDTVHGGKLRIEGATAPDAPETIAGTVSIGSFDVKGLPVLMQLMNATSPFGLADLLSGTVAFDHLKGKFRLTGDTVEFSDVNAPGTAVGLNVEGKLDIQSGDAALHGTVVPFSVFNRILGSIPVIGDMMTGGKAAACWPSPIESRARSITPMSASIRSRC